MKKHGMGKKLLAALLALAMAAEPSTTASRPTAIMCSA